MYVVGLYKLYSM